MSNRSRAAGAIATLASLSLAAAPALAPRATLSAQEQRLSPLDSATATLAGADLAVRYGRPSMRGRVVFGDLVPYGRVWRTGANEATQFRTEADLRIGDAEIPAGHYSLYSIPRPDGWTLIVNGQTGQWGTQYDPERDVARIRMEVERIARPVETFTVTLEPAPDEEGVDGRLSMEWERTRASVPILVTGAPPAADTTASSENRSGGRNE